MSPTLRNTLIVAAAVVVSLLVASAGVWWAASREVVTRITSLSHTGSTGRALVVYHPGLSDFPDRITSAFAAGMASAGWRVDRTTASRRAPTDLSGYDLVVLGSPVYANAAAPPLTRYLDRLGDLGGRPVVLVFTAAGDAGPALETSAAQAAAHHGRVVARLGYTTQQIGDPPPGDTGPQVERAARMARDAGRGLRAVSP
ncbi:flavodoxin family protein [Piscinibacter gummiphilus]|uniref:NAD(P)H-dependent oxidoreductase n=1 Tax=Piscinibacter gummiphilus TaxID=946333 RepID=A0ABZ0D5L6_9BURK|nr:NAD(P)H-dependent oxidoreductase [Piscinibacter gummiphilus]WOB10635.1 NAD(P)H-dependent oxidoreductase [Piscinibacter gummiphilus]